MRVISGEQLANRTKKTIGPVPIALELLCERIVRHRPPAGAEDFSHGCAAALGDVQEKHDTLLAGQWQLMAASNLRLGDAEKDVFTSVVAGDAARQQQMQH
jgi:hypothetical protein